jgi:hypothetical protein
MFSFLLIYLGWLAVLNSFLFFVDEEARQVFNRWRQLFQIQEYKDNEEEEMRFNFFKDSLHTKISDLMLRIGLNLVHLADSPKQELDEFAMEVNRVSFMICYCAVSLEYLNHLEAHGFLPPRPKTLLSHD